MPLSLLVGTVALSLVGHADSLRAVAKPSVVPPRAANGAPADSSSQPARRSVVFLPTASSSKNLTIACRCIITGSFCAAIWLRSGNSRSATKCG